MLVSRLRYLSAWLPSRRAFGAFALRSTTALLWLVVPTILAYFFLDHKPVRPLLTMSFLVAVAISGWRHGWAGGLMVSAGSIVALTAITTKGKLLIPPTLDFAATVDLILIAVLADRIASARRRSDALLRAANAELETRVRERTAELESARQWLHITLASIRDAVIATDARGDVAFMNPVAEALLACPEAEARGRPLGDVLRIAPDGEPQSPLAEPASALLQSPGALPLPERTILLNRHGAVIPIEIDAAPIQDGSEQPAGIVCTFRDISQRRQAERAAEESRTRLERANNELQQFAYAVAHDLQEPLRNVSVFTTLLGRNYRGKLDSDADEFINYAVTGAVRMEALLKDLLAYIQIPAASEEEVPPASLDSVLDQVLRDLQFSIRESGARVIRSPLPTVTVHKGHAQQLFQNLISNAIKYRAADPPRIEIAATESGEAWQICVRDNGMGIDPTYSRHVFGLFKRLHTNGKYPGTGIGLALCQRIVERYNGTIWVESQPGKGSSFYFTLPACQSISAAAASALPGSASR